jgi:hypothetical protein
MINGKTKPKVLNCVGNYDESIALFDFVVGRKKVKKAVDFSKKAGRLFSR